MMSLEERAALQYRWPFWARDNQLAPPGDWMAWFVRSGRGFGKTRLAGEWVRNLAESGKVRRIALIARTAADARDTMVEGESGLMAICPPWDRPKYEPSKRRLTWPNGCMATLFTADEPDLLRGPQYEFAWCDELASWRYGAETWDNLMMGLRLGKHPQALITTTPRPTKLVKALLKEPDTVVTTGSTHENLRNLAPTFQRRILRYEGTRLGRQELHGEILEDTPGALWTLTSIEENRAEHAPQDLARVVISIDPAVTAHEDSDETGITTVGRQGREEDGTGYVLDDRSGIYTPEGWCAAALSSYDDWSADCIVCEVNNGGDLVEATIRLYCKSIGRDCPPIKQVRASRGKATRAEPYAMLYTRNRVKHVGVFDKLEDQMTTWVPGEKSPDRMDALVWGLAELFPSESEPVVMIGRVF